MWIQWQGVFFPRMCSGGKGKYAKHSQEPIEHTYARYLNEKKNTIIVKIVLENEGFHIDHAKSPKV
jgi:hypothetical protein